VALGGEPGPPGRVWASGQTGFFIQEAVDFVGGLNGRSNTTVDVDPGTYRETVNVPAFGLVPDTSVNNPAPTKAYPTGLTLEGLQNATVSPTNFANPVTPNPARGAESILQNPLGTALSNNSNALVRVAADGVGVVGLTLEGDPGTTGAPNTFATFGVLAQDAGTLLVNGAPTTT